MFGYQENPYVPEASAAVGRAASNAALKVNLSNQLKASPDTANC